MCILVLCTSPKTFQCFILLNADKIEDEKNDTLPMTVGIEAVENDDEMIIVIDVDNNNNNNSSNLPSPEQHRLLA